MKKIIVLVLMSFCFYQGFSQKKKDLIKEVAQLKLKSVALQEKLAFYEQQRKVNLQDSLQNFGYAFGLGIGNNLKTLGFDTIASQAFRLALDDVIAGKEKISLKEAQRIVQGTIEHKQEKEAKEKSKEGLDFLAEKSKSALYRHAYQW